MLRELNLKTKSENLSSNYPPLNFTPLRDIEDGEQDLFEIMSVLRNEFKSSPFRLDFSTESAKSAITQIDASLLDVSAMPEELLTIAAKGKQKANKSANSLLRVQQRLLNLDNLDETDTSAQAGAATAETQNAFLKDGDEEEDDEHEAENDEDEDDEEEDNDYIDTYFDNGEGDGDNDNEDGNDEAY